MPEVSSVQRSDVRAAIARASAATGVDFNYLLAQAKIESALDPSARARTSSAAGLYQFTAGTWLETLDRHGARHGLGWADDAIDRSSGRTAVHPGMRGHLMALRFDPNASALMAAELARDNAGELRGVLGREPDSAELYLAHFLGAGGAAMEGGAPDWGPSSPSAALQMASARPPSSSLSPPSAPGPARRPSMAETLQATFGGAQLPGRAGEQVGEAYAKFKAFNL